jgi:hypothetical protein
LIVVGIGEVSEPIHMRVGFYGTIAQMIPVLMLVAAVEGRYFRTRKNDHRRAFHPARILVRRLIGIGASPECSPEYRRPARRT